MKTENKVTVKNSTLRNVTIKNGSATKNESVKNESAPIREDIKEIGELVKKHRIKKGWTQGQLAERANVLPAGISHFETGKRSLSLDRLSRIAKAFNCYIDFAPLVHPDADQLVLDMTEAVKIEDYSKKREAFHIALTL